MDSASSLAFPGGRLLAGWWRQLQPYRPTALWVGHIFVHRVEALIESAEPRPLDALALHLLRAVAMDAAATAEETLPARLHLPRSAILQLLRGLEARDLVARGPPGGWCLSDRGRAVLAAGGDPAARRGRQSFAFAERLSPAGRRLASPHPLPLAECLSVAWQPDDAHRFDVSLLDELLAQPADWKARYGLPAGAARVVRAEEGGANGTWEQVIVDRPERVMVALIAADQTLLGFAARVEGWKLLDDTPVLRLPADARDALQELALSGGAWEEAWRMWCRQRHLPLGDAEACRLHFDGAYLDVRAPAPFAERLRQSKSDLAREESGLLAGDGYLRAAALLRLHAE